MTGDLIREQYPQLQPPYVSVILPIYNVEAYLRRALDSLVFQTLEDIEIICVNDASPDGSQAIIDEYVAAYPGKVISLRHEVNQGQGVGRGTGFRQARGEYMMFLDPDDFLDGRACEAALTTALEEGHDMVGIHVMAMDENGVAYPYVSLPDECTHSNMIRNAPASFCSFLMHRSLLEGKDVFLPMFFEDASIIPWLLSQAKSIGKVARGTQYFYTQRKDSTMGSFLTGERRAHLFLADDILWERACEPYLADFAYRIAKRMVNTLSKFPSLYVQTVQHIQRLYPTLELHLPEDFPKHTRDILEEVLQMPSQPIVPMNVCLAAPANEERLATLEAIGFPAEQIRVLEQTDAVPAAVLAKGEAEVAAYLAMERIYQEGGVYLAPQAQPLPALATLLFSPAFFCAGTEYTVSLHLFGGAPGNDVMGKVLASYHNGRFPEELSLAQRLSHILMTQHAVHLTGDNEHGINVQIISAVFSTLPGKNHCCYLNAPAPEGECIIQPMDTFLFAQEKRSEQFVDAKVQQKLEQAQNKLVQILQQCEDFKTQRDEAKAQRDEAKTQRNEAKIQRDEVKAQYNEAIAQRNEARAQRDHARSQRDDALRQAAQFKTQRDEVKLQRDDVKAKLAKAKAECAALSQENSQLRAELEATLGRRLRRLFGRLTGKK